MNFFRGLISGMSDALPWNVRKDTNDFFRNLLTPKMRWNRDVMLSLFDTYSKDGDTFHGIYQNELMPNGEFIKEVGIIVYQNNKGNIGISSLEPILDRKAFKEDPTDAAWIDTKDREGKHWQVSHYILYGDHCGLRAHQINHLEP